jgi:predicted nucleic acid-binding protein
LKVFLDACFLIYLNTSTHDERRSLDDLFKRILVEDLYMNLLVMDETLYISRSKYGVPYETTLSFFKNIILPYTEVISIGESHIDALEKYLLQHGIKPSDAIHLSAMENKGIVNIVSEDEVFDKVEGINRVWL